MKTSILAASLAFCLSATAHAQNVPLLSETLFETSWAVIGFEGTGGSDFVPIISLKGQEASGDTGCGTDWTSHVSVNLPAIRFTKVEGALKGCDSPARASRFLEALRQVRSTRTSPDGLELLGQDGSRLLLLVAGG